MRMADELNGFQFMGSTCINGVDPSCSSTIELGCYKHESFYHYYGNVLIFGQKMDLKYDVN
jgi:hypothetical protein